MNTTCAWEDPCVVHQHHFPSICTFPLSRHLPLTSYHAGKVTTIVASEGDSVAFECNGTMGTNFSLLLTLNDSAATETRYTIPHTTNCTDHCIATFLLLNVTRDDSGTYQCTYDSDVYQLTVNGECTDTLIATTVERFI